jgi:ABC-type lipoprotein release transport system permease subunit
MWILVKTAWRNLFRQPRRTGVTLSAMAVSLSLAIPTYGLTEGLMAEMFRGATGMDLGHIQIHDPAYPRGRALQSALEDPERLLGLLRVTPGVASAAPRVLGHALASRDVQMNVTLVGLAPAEEAALGQEVLFGRALDPSAPWRRAGTRECEALVERAAAQRHGISVGLVLTPGAARPGGACERIRVVGLTRRAGVPASPDARLVVALPRADVERGFGAPVVPTTALFRHAAPLALTGVDPLEERRVSFMVEKVVQGRFLDPMARGEMVVGTQLAKTLRLGLGDKVFVQAASLDPASGSYYQDFTVVGLYRTGVDLVDRSRVFLHLSDAQRLMSLGARAHEIVVLAQRIEDLDPLARQIRTLLSRQRLTVTTDSRGKRARGRPLPAPVTVLDLEGEEAALLVPFDLKRRFDDLPGLEALARRVYGETEVAAALRLAVRLAPRPEGALLSKEAPGPCGGHLPEDLGRRLGLEASQELLLAQGLHDGCERLRILGFHPERGGGLPTILFPDGSTRDEEGETLSAGTATLLVPGARQKLRFVGVEIGLERRVWAGDSLLASGHFPEDRETRSVPPVVLSERAARALGASRGSDLLLKTRDPEGHIRWQSARVAGILRDDRWAPDLPALLLPYSAAQEVDAPRLNARAHELVLLPRPGVEPAALAGAAAQRLAPLVRTWAEIAPQLARVIRFQDAITAILLGVVFAMAAMTVMNTMFMVVFERTREFGVLKSLGMGPGQVFGLIVLETLFVALLAAALGGGLGFALDYWLSEEGIDLSAYTSGITYEGAFLSPIWKSVLTVKSIFLPVVMVATLCLLVSIFPALRAGRLRPVEALWHRG